MVGRLSVVKVWSQKEATFNDSPKKCVQAFHFISRVEMPTKIKAYTNEPTMIVHLQAWKVDQRK